MANQLQHGVIVSMDQQITAEQIKDHPAGCFYGSFVNAYANKWHVVLGCELDHGAEPIFLNQANSLTKEKQYRYG